ncbi:hypothetical protein DDE83_001098 [Stemphylium lycopersici]|uniref:Uncharacterized protein n=1 Tax=Stemphylium lycopersici TaxID=183478 RepID=A0A364NE15_STELY|nr:hypothetical protein DDE83_001098 [Stemphylium lycopersici]
MDYDLQDGTDACTRASCRAKIAELQAKNAELEAKITELEDRIEDNWKYIESLHEKDHDLEAKNAELEAKITELEDRIEDNWKYIESLHEKNHDLEEKYVASRKMSKAAEENSRSQAKDKKAWNSAVLERDEVIKEYTRKCKKLQDLYEYEKAFREELERINEELLKKDELERSGSRTSPSKDHGASISHENHETAVPRSTTPTPSFKIQNHVDESNTKPSDHKPSAPGKRRAESVPGKPAAAPVTDDNKNARKKPKTKHPKTSRDAEWSKMKDQNGNAPESFKFTFSVPAPGSSDARPVSGSTEPAARVDQISWPDLNDSATARP